ncbi:Lysophosphatidylcholine acyltransferase [Diplonema papillatum]|nr:Lysophosphatidylcholine acyltransferase [Diplonema papillatum]|eukprot:gene15942-24382_t
MHTFNKLVEVVVVCLALFIFGRALFWGGDDANAGQRYLNTMTSLLHNGPKFGPMPTFSDVAGEMQEKALRELFEELDTNKDGVIQYEEFKGMTLNTWAAFRAMDLALKSRLSLQPFRDMRETVKETFQSLQANLPEELRLLPEASWLGQAHKAAIWYFFFLCFVQLVLCAWENTLAFVGIKAFYWPSQPDVSKVKKISKEASLQYDTPLDNWYEAVKLTVMSLSGLAVLRMVQAIVFVVIGMTAVNVAVMIPNKYWKLFWLRGVVSFCIAATLFSLGYYRVGIEGRVASKEECKLLIGNHIAVVEVLVMFGLSFPSFISATENLALPMFSGVVRACDAILVDRKDPKSRRVTMHEIKKRAADPEAPQLMIFPEGTLANQQSLFVYKTGAFESGQPVQPICYKYPFTHFNPCWTGEATGGNEVGEVLWRSLCQVVNRIEIKILPVYHPSDEEKQDKVLYAENVRRLMAAHLKCGVSDCVFEDYVHLSRGYAKLKQADRRKGRDSKGWWVPFYRPRKVNKIDLQAHSDDDCNSLTSAEDLADRLDSSKTLTPTKNAEPSEAGATPK